MQVKLTVFFEVKTEVDRCDIAGHPHDNITAEKCVIPVVTVTCLLK